MTPPTDLSDETKVGNITWEQLKIDGIMEEIFDYFWYEGLPDAEKLTLAKLIMY